MFDTVNILPIFTRLAHVEPTRYTIALTENVGRAVQWLLSNYLHTARTLC